MAAGPTPLRVTAESLVGPLEYRCLRVLWGADGPCSVGDVLDALNLEDPDAGNLAYTTVMTVLVRLHEKGILDRELDGRRFHYDASMDEPALVEHLGRREVDDLLARYGGVAVAQFASAMQDADPEHLAMLRRLVEADDDA